MLRLAAQRLRRPCGAGAAGFGAAAAAAGGAAVALAWSAPAQAATMAENRPLGGPSARHRVALTAWPINDDPCGTFSSAQELFAHAKRAGYDGLELTVDDFRKSFFPGRTYQEITREVRTLSVSSGVQIVGSLYHVSDGGWRREHEDGAPGRWDLDFNDPDFWRALDERVQADKELGSEYVTFQISLPPEHLNTGGEYRDDRAYVQRAAERIARMQEVVFRHGLNFYVETHIDRLSEDVVGFARIMDACPVYFEVNADISHYVYRGIKKGSALAKILGRVGHTHQRMAREHGDLSADVADPEKDWAAKGLTWQAFEAMKPAFEGGLSSRCVVGESGPMHLVKDALALDAKLVPLYRLMAEECDAKVGLGGRSSGPPGLRAGAVPSGISEAEKVLEEHFGSAAIAPPQAAAVQVEGGMSSAEADEILRQHFSAR